MKLQEGAYENIITGEMRECMAETESQGLVCRQEEMDKAESPSFLAEHINQ